MTVSPPRDINVTDVCNCHCNLMLKCIINYTRVRTRAHKYKNRIQFVIYSYAHPSYCLLAQ